MDLWRQAWATTPVRVKETLKGKVETLDGFLYIISKFWFYLHFGPNTWQVMSILDVFCELYKYVTIFSM